MNQLKTSRKRPSVPIGNLSFYGSRPKTYRYIDSKSRKAVFLFTPDSGLEKYVADFVKHEKGYDVLDLSVSSIGLKLFIELINANPSDKIITTILNANQNEKGG